MGYFQPLSRLVAQFSKLPGVGAKTAQRYAYKIINMSEEEVQDFADALVDTKKSIHYCSICGNYTQDDVCEICATRDKSIICVVKEPKDIVAFEKIKDYRGVYHVLQGTLNPMQGIGADDLKIKELMSRIHIPFLTQQLAYLQSAKVLRIRRLENRCRSIEETARWQQIIWN